jgi:hypothetical protein
MRKMTHAPIDTDGFRLRGIEMARIDAFSDVVFGFALTLLVVSLEVPKTFAELHASLLGFLPFGICFYFLMSVWHQHYKYFRRFGTHDKRTIIINSVLLFVVLFYVYPLKFLFTVITYGLLGFSNNFFESYRQLVELMVLYGAGFAAIQALLLLLYANAYGQRAELALTPVEEALTKGYIAQAAGGTLVGLIACALAIAVPQQYSGYTGWAYVLMWPVGNLVGRWSRRRVNAARERLAPGENLPETVAVQALPGSNSIVPAP